MSILDNTTSLGVLLQKANALSNADSVRPSEYPSLSNSILNNTTRLRYLLEQATGLPTGGGGGGSDSSVEIVTWADGTDEQIVAMVAAADRGEINLADYWAVGDTRTVSLSAMEATGVGESHAAQDVEFVLMHAGGYELNSATESGRTTCSFIVGMKNCLNTTGYMNSSDTNHLSWDASARRTWCNDIFYNAVPNTLRNIFKQFKTITAVIYNGSPNKTSIDYFTIPAVKEIFGGGTASSGGSATSYSNVVEFNALFQYDWYKTALNRVKTVNGSAHHWWTRSPYYSDSLYFCAVLSNGSVARGYASHSIGLAPVGCI